MSQHKPMPHRAAVLLSTIFLALIVTAPAPSLSSDTSYAFSWGPGSRLTVVEWWNAPERAGCDYAANPWPQAELAAQRGLVLGARQVLLEEWDISSWIAANRTDSGEARIHGAETNCYNGHRDYPPHVHVFYWYEDTNGTRRSINSHHYPNAQGQVYRNFVIPSMCDQRGSYHAEPDAWLDILDETCTAVWQQRYTSAGDLELRRDPLAPIYTVKVREIRGDLVSIDVLSSTSVGYTIDIVEYDPHAFRMMAVISDYKRNLRTIQTWIGDPATGRILVSHNVEAAGVVAP